MAAWSSLTEAQENSGPEHSQFAGVRQINLVHVRPSSEHSEDKNEHRNDI